MKGLRKKFRRGLAAFLAFVLTMTSVNTVSLADVSNALETEKATFVMSGEDIVESAQAAIDSGSTFTYEDLGIEETGSTAKEYQKLFTNGTVYEIAPSYDLDEEENADGANLRMFIRVKGETEGYQITGEEEIIFLYINDSESKIAFRSRIDDYVTDKVTVKGNSSLAETEKPVLDENGNAIEGDKPAQTPEESTVPSGETGSVEETKEPETEAPHRNRKNRCRNRRRRYQRRNRKQQHRQKIRRQRLLRRQKPKNQHRPRYRNRKHRPQCRSQRHRHRKLMRQHRRRKCRNQIQKLRHRNRNQKHRHRNQRRQIQEMKPRL